MDKTILVTGFGPFAGHPINASWEAVKLLNELNFDGYKLVAYEVPVTYKDVDEFIPKLWNQYQPQFVLHVGVSGEANALTLETLANRKPYVKIDAAGETHPTGEVCTEDEGPDVHYPDIDVQQILDELHDEHVNFVKSTNAGLYLCEYIFYTSLNIDKRRILFTHVPPLEKPYTAEELAHGLTLIIHAALRQLQQETPGQLKHKL